MDRDERRRWTAAIHVAKRATGLDDDAYRAVLSGSAGVSSAAEVRTRAQFREVMRAFARLGFTTARRDDRRGGGERAPGWMTARQEYYIRGLWRLAARNKDGDALRAFVRRITGADDLSFLSRSEARDVILALRKVAEDAGFDPDCAGGGKCC